MKKNAQDKRDAAGNAILELEQFLPYRLSVLSNTASRAIADLYERRFGLSIAEWRTMAVLGSYAGIAAREVAERTAMDKVAVSRALARLIADGRVRRRTAAHDKRQSVLGLTAKGWKVYAEVAPLALEHEKRLLAHLNAEERRWLAHILDRLWQAELEEITK
ncbi:MAG: MarR family winged helix-turn-helix transcriptional regulator [Rudaea sp.]|uniref:MarR family winged helix-turn-helix transcriptional regulator n=1 Tax=Rudaea sp. TaxID=2136325 RepID=UPI0039E4634D